MKTAQILSEKIKEASRKLTELERLDRAITHHYNSGTITASELSRLDGMIMARIAKLSAS